MLKRPFLALLILLFAGAFISAHAVDWTVANQSTIGWDAVTKTTEGTDFPAGDTIKYEVYIVKDGADKTTATKLDETTALEYTITFTMEGRWLAGVKSIRTPAASPTDIQESSISWSDSVDIAAVPVPFGFIFFEAPANPGGLGPK